MESSETITMLPRSLYDGIEDYSLLQEGNKSILAERNELCYRSEGLEADLAKVRSSTVEDITTLEARVRSAKAHNVDVAATGEKRLRYFESELIKDLAGCMHYMNTTSKALEVCACRCPRVSLRPLITFIGYPRR
jgi:hypothetical protein